MTQSDRLQYRLDAIRNLARILGWNDSRRKQALKLTARIERTK